MDSALGVCKIIKYINALLQSDDRPTGELSPRTGKYPGTAARPVFLQPFSHKRCLHARHHASEMWCYGGRHEQDHRESSSDGSSDAHDCAASGRLRRAIRRFRRECSVCDKNKVWTTSWRGSQRRKRSSTGCVPWSAPASATSSTFAISRLTYTSNAIEGNTLSAAETTLVIEKGITIGGKPLKDHLEAIDQL